MYFLTVPGQIAGRLPGGESSKRIRVALDGWGGKANYMPPHKRITGLSPSKGKEAKEQLRAIAKARMTGLGLAELRGKFALRIRYRQAETAWDAANVVGGIADALSRCVYRDDRNLREIQCQVEEGGGQDEYWVTVEPKW